MSGYLFWLPADDPVVGWTKKIVRRQPGISIPSEPVWGAEEPAAMITLVKRAAPKNPKPFPEGYRADDLPCRQNDPDLWFAERPEKVAEAKRLCADCPAPVKQWCLESALDNEEKHGIWAGTTPEEREEMRNA
jgi:hypothetical protein